MAFASFHLLCLGCFVLINLHNILRVHKRERGVEAYAEVEHPVGFVVGLAAVGTGVYFLEALIYLFLVFSSLFSTVSFFSFISQSQLWIAIKISGSASSGIGYLLFIWSVVIRGKYAVSWKMPENQKLVTDGPYRYVRHPSYLGYFLMFIGLFLVWPNIFTLFPLCAIPGYLRVAVQEEKLLARRFGQQYLEYQKKTGRFIPKI